MRAPISTLTLVLPMALLAFWKSNADAVLGLTVQQILASAGDGRLRDGSECSREFRQFLREAPSDYLYRYVQHCLDSPFNRVASSCKIS
jgi:hypothetical protein